MKSKCHFVSHSLSKVYARVIIREHVYVYIRARMCVCVRVWVGAACVCVCIYVCMCEFNANIVSTTAAYTVSGGLKK